MSSPPNAFIGRTTAPSDADLPDVLGRSKALWDRIVAELAAEHGVATQEWRSYSPKAGWSLRLQRGSRTVVWLAPRKGSFLVVCILGDKAVAAARQAGLPPPVLAALDEAPRHPEGTGLRLTVTSAKDVAVVKTLAATKIRNS